MTIYFCCCQFPYVFDIVLLIVIYVLQVHIFSLYDISFLTEPCTSANSLITWLMLTDHIIFSVVMDFLFETDSVSSFRKWCKIVTNEVIINRVTQQFRAVILRYNQLRL